MFGSTNTLENHRLYTINEWNSGYYKEVLNFLKEKKIKAFLDIGSCSGVLYEILFSEIETMQKCIMVEAVNENFNFIKNKYTNDSIKIYNKAVFYGQDEIPIGSVNGNVGSYSYLSSINVNKVKTVTIEQILKESKGFLGEIDIDFIKIDIEGAEYNLIENSDILKNIKYIEIEFHNNKDYGIFEGKNRFDIWYPFLKKYLPEHELVLGGNKKYKWPNGEEVLYDGSGFFVKKN